jgi:hypothetical protein
VGLLNNAHHHGDRVALMARGLPPFEKECFFISPIGEEGSETRQRANGVLNAIVEPAATAVGLAAVRADRIGEGGQVNLQIIEHVCRSAVAVADLTGGNLNVYYEVGMRHTARLPLVLIADESEREQLPFDILTQRTIFFANDMNGVANCQAEAVEQLRAGLDGAVDSPLGAAINIRSFQQGDAVQRTLAELVTSVDGLSREISRGARDVSPLAVRDAVQALRNLERIASERADDELAALSREFAGPLNYMMRRVPIPERGAVDVRRVRREAADRVLADRVQITEEQPLPVNAPKRASRAPKGASSASQRASSASPGKARRPKTDRSDA